MTSAYVVNSQYYNTLPDKKKITVDNMKLFIATNFTIIK